MQLSMVRVWASSCATVAAPFPSRHAIGHGHALFGAAFRHRRIPLARRWCMKLASRRPFISSSPQITFVPGGSPSAIITVRHERASKDALADSAPVHTDKHGSGPRSQSSSAERQHRPVHIARHAIFNIDRRTTVRDRSGRVDAPAAALTSLRGVREPERKGSSVVKPQHTTSTPSAYAGWLRT
eukprot:66001-Chlamydomonas_euryale.AAC.6